MPATTIRILIAIFFIVHGLMYAGLTNVPMPEPGGLRTPFWPSWWRPNVDENWLAVKLGLPSDAVRLIGSGLWVLALAGFVLAGLGLLGIPGLKEIWVPASGAAAAVSLVLFVFYWHNWFVAGAAINVAVLIGIALSWPAALFSQA
ncbi:MAG TPA: hypothetical protein VFF68_11900 [Anaerolineaceae bacterium]|nr:hypothetical protein [Anaerolineaceae bacterium]